MVAVISGSDLGLLNSSLSTLGGRGATGEASLGQGNERIYLNASTGNLVIQHQDEFISSQGLDLAVLRTYNSQGQLDVGDYNNDNWRLSTSRLESLVGTVNTAGSQITRVAADGSASDFVYDEARGLYVSVEGDGAHDTLGYDATTQLWTWDDSERGISETYNEWAIDGVIRLQSRIDRDGDTVAYGYTADGRLNLLDSGSDQVLIFYRSGDDTLIDHIHTVADGQAETRTYYDYDVLNRLTSVTIDLTPGDLSTADANTYVTTYTYDADTTRVAGITQSDGSYIAFTYVQDNGVWKVQTITDGENKQTQFSYETGVAQVELGVNADVLQTEQAEAMADSRALDTDSLSLERTHTEQIYDANGNIIAEIERVAGENRTTHYVYDSNNRLIYTIDPDGYVTESIYDSLGQLVSERTYDTPVVMQDNAAINEYGLVYDFTLWELNRQEGVQSITLDMDGFKDGTPSYFNVHLIPDDGSASTAHKIGRAHV